MHGRWSMFANGCFGGWFHNKLDHDMGVRIQQALLDGHILSIYVDSWFKKKNTTWLITCSQRKYVLKTLNRHFNLSSQSFTTHHAESPTNGGRSPAIDPAFRNILGMLGLNWLDMTILIQAINPSQPIMLQRDHPCPQPHPWEHDWTLVVTTVNYHESLVITPLKPLVPNHFCKPFL